MTQATRDPEAAAAAAKASGDAVPFEKVFEAELECIRKSRARRGVEPAPPALEGQGAECSRGARLLGLAFSGGGIRSATLNLGLLQALAELNILRHADYLSTVSGGGYIGSWLQSWIHREGLGKVSQGLTPKNSAGAESGAQKSPYPEPHPIKWLRQYSNYLSPRLGLFSVDAWTVVAVWMRNTLLNLLVLIPVLCGLLLLPRVLTRLPWLIVSAGRGIASGLLVPLGCAAALLGFVLAAHLIRTNLKTRAEASGSARSVLGIHLGICGSVFLSALGMTTFLGRGTDYAVRGRISWLDRLPRLSSWCGPSELLVGGVIFFVLALVLFVLSREYSPAAEPDTRRMRIKLRLYGCLTPAVVGAVLLVASLNALASTDRVARQWHLAALGVPAVLFVYSLVVILHLGLLGRDLGDQYREWWSRLSALLTTYMLGWCGLFGAAIYGPLLLAWLVNLAYGRYLASGLGVGWLATTIGGAITARGSHTTGQKSGAAEMLAKVAPAVFVCGLVLLLSFGIHLALIQTPGRPLSVGHRAGDVHHTELRIPVEGGQKLAISYDNGSAPSATTIADLDCTWGCKVPTAAQLQAFHFQLLFGRTRWALGGLLVCGFLAWRLASRVDVNEFSMHHFYRNRLVRCYLGASRERHANFFTGFDPQDDLPLRDLVNERTECAGPYPIVNTTLNVVRGDELAWQERKAESFVFTPLFSGFDARASQDGQCKLCDHGYRPTEQYAFTPRGIQVGNATAISGAAASPNMGFHTSPSTAFLMTVFNVRLGWWIGNPRRSDGWQCSGPTFGLLQLLAELTASTNDKSRYLYLSDGGHFENLGLYELVRRRCQYVIACDGGCDPAFSLEDLGNAIRKCRADFGVEIEIDCGDIRAGAGAGEGRSKAHCAVGTIRYPDAPRGTLVYIKASLTGDEPTDVLQYATLHRGFPHQGTGDQFYDESQFESYRALGYHTGMSVLQEIAARRAAANAGGGGRGLADPIGADRDRFFSDLREYWYASSPKTAASFTKHAEALTDLMRQLREERNLAFMDEQISPEWPRLMEGAPWQPAASQGLPPGYEQRRAGFHFCNSLIQLMEDVYLDLDLENESAHPDNVGWINLFRHWSWSSMFRVTWAISQGCFGSRFRNFCYHTLGLGLEQLGTITLDPPDAEGINDPRLNFREREILQSMAGNGRFDPAQDELLLLQIRVSPPNPAEKKKDLVTLTFGFAVVEKVEKKDGTKEKRLAYLRVQDHLRCMGLARRAIEAMCRGSLINGIEWRPFGHELPEQPKEEDKRRVQRMWQAVCGR